MAGVFEEIGSPEIDADSLDTRMASGGMLPPGLYPAQLVGAKNTESKQKQTPGYELKFVVTAGPFKGAEVTDTLYRTDNQRTKDRIALFGHRLGLLERNKDGKLVPAKGKAEFLDVLDTHTVIEVMHESYQKDDGSEGHAVRLAFNGVHDPADPKVVEILKNGGQRPPAPEKERKAEAKGGGKADASKKGEEKKRDLSDL